MSSLYCSVLLWKFFNTFFRIGPFNVSLLSLLCNTTAHFSRTFFAAGSNCLFKVSNRYTMLAGRVGAIDGLD